MTKIKEPVAPNSNQLPPKTKHKEALVLIILYYNIKQFKMKQQGTTPKSRFNTKSSLSNTAPEPYFLTKQKRSNLRTPPTYDKKKMRKPFLTKLKYSHKCSIKTIIQTSAAKTLKYLKTMATPRQKKLAAKKRKTNAKADARRNEEKITEETAASKKN